MMPLKKTPGNPLNQSSASYYPTSDHFKEEESLMEKHNFHGLDHHQQEHRIFQNKIKEIKKMYDENIHTTHIAYRIRQLIDALIAHIQHTDIKMKGLT